ncbi:MAG TPA: hypothetical protein VKI19_09875 [Acidimicrobiales bacterium]|nr:hypothetical protein [Acidimicrobiales bacterium]
MTEAERVAEEILFPAAYAALRRPGPAAASARPGGGGGFIVDGHARWRRALPRRGC